MQRVSERDVEATTMLAVGSQKQSNLYTGAGFNEEGGQSTAQRAKATRSLTARSATSRGIPVSGATTSVVFESCVTRMMQRERGGSKVVVVVVA